MPRCNRTHVAGITGNCILSRSWNQRTHSVLCHDALNNWRVTCICIACSRDAHLQRSINQIRCGRLWGVRVLVAVDDEAKVSVFRLDNLRLAPVQVRCALCVVDISCANLSKNASSCSPCADVAVMRGAIAPIIRRGRWRCLISSALAQWTRHSHAHVLDFSRRPTTQRRRLYLLLQARKAMTIVWANIRFLRPVQTLTAWYV